MPYTMNNLAVKLIRRTSENYSNGMTFELVLMTLCLLLFKKTENLPECKSSVLLVHRLAPNNHAPAVQFRKLDTWIGACNRCDAVCGGEHLA